MPLRQDSCQTRGHVLGNSCHFRILDFTHSLERRLLLMIAPDRALVCRSRLERTNGGSRTGRVRSADEQIRTTKCCLAQEIFGLVFVPRSNNTDLA